MSFFEWIALALGVALCLYLFVALVRPEAFD